VLNLNAGQDDRQPAASAGRLLLLTRPAAQASEWVSKLHACGLPAAALPLLVIGPAPDPLAVAQMMAALVPGALVMFVSPSAVGEAAAAVGGRLHWPAQVRAAATGPGTVAALQAAGVPLAQIVAPAADAAQFDSEALWQQLRAETWAQRPVWIVRGEGGRDWFARTLADAGAQVHTVQGYARTAPVLTAPEQALLDQALAAPGRVGWVFSSSEAIDHLARLAPGADWSGALAWASHPRIAARARQLGVGRVLPVQPGLAALVAAARAEAAG
jgi:uroporphyrinogen-III synthase